MKPIMLWITSRSRSSMVAAIFIKHGVWWGNTPAQISGYEMNENQKIKGLLKKYKTKHWKRVHLSPVSTQWNKEFTTDLMKIVPNDQQWMMKTGVEYYPAFRNISPHDVFIYRSPEGVAKSLSDKRADVEYQDALEVAKWRFNYMEQLRTVNGGVFVNTDEIISGDFTTLQDAFDYCKIDFSSDLAKEAIL